MCKTPQRGRKAIPAWVRKSIKIMPVAFSIGLSFFSTALASFDLKSGLIGHWPFETNGLESSGSGNNGAFSGPVAISQGTNKSAMDLSNNGYMGLGTGTNLFITNQLTVAAWIYARGPFLSGGRQTILSRYNGIGFTFDLFDSTAHPRIIAGSSTLESPVSIPHQTWVHLAGVYDGNNCRLYMNGILLIAGPSTGNVPTSGSLLAGARSDAGPGHFFIGKIDELFFYRRVLNIDEIRELMDLSGNPPLVTVQLYGVITTDLGSPLEGVFFWCTHPNNRANGCFSLADGTFDLSVPQATNFSLEIRPPKGSRIAFMKTNLVSEATNYFSSFSISYPESRPFIGLPSAYHPDQGDLTIEVIRPSPEPEKICVDLITTTGSRKIRLFEGIQSGVANRIVIPRIDVMRLTTSGAYILQVTGFPEYSKPQAPPSFSVHRILVFAL